MEITICWFRVALEMFVQLILVIPNITPMVLTTGNYSYNVTSSDSNYYKIILIIGVCILLHVILIVNNNTFCFATTDKVFYII
jgi:hypothetical protein